MSIIICVFFDDVPAWYICLSDLCVMTLPGFGDSGKPVSSQLYILVASSSIRGWFSSSIKSQSSSNHCAKSV